MKTKPVDRRVRRTLAQLQSALRELILERGYDRITVREVIHRADVGRSTFYTHFTDKDALLLAGLESLHSELGLADGKPAPTLADRAPLGFSKAVFEHAGTHRRLYQAFLGRKSAALLRRYFRKTLIAWTEEDAQRWPVRTRAKIPRAAMIAFSADALMSMLSYWLEQAPTMTALEAEGAFRALVLSGLEGAGIGRIRPGS